ncbi:MAG TPA: hypothetical protein DEP87_00110 [Candidatus Pacebacteria bacterium]|nr:hypothetical protein [Candidatus Paceibacterota bacterium]
MSFSPPVSVVIPNHNGVRLLEKNLPAVFKSLRAGDELVLIDDASTDESVLWIKTKFNCQQIPSFFSETELWQGSNSKITLKLLVNLKNRRFGMSCNRGVEVATHDYIFLLNSDVVPQSDVLTPLLAHFDPEKNGDLVFGVGCLEVDSTDNTSQAGKQQLWFERGLFFHSKASNFNSGETAWVTGGSGLFSKSKWLAIGGFNAIYYPAYWEDIDLSFQARKRGWKVLFEAKARVEHNHETTNQTIFGQKKIAEMSWRNAKKFTWRNGNFWQKLAFLLWQPYWWWKYQAMAIT